MSFTAQYEVSTPEVVAEDFGSEIVILNLNNGKYFSLTGLASNLWRDLAAGHSPQRVIDQLSQTYGQQAAAIQQFVETLIGEQLIRSRSSANEILDPAHATVVITMSPEAVFPPLEMYDDMAELILSDPIHDVDEEMGWPVKPRS